MPETSVRLSEEHRDLIQDVADQLDTSIKSVVGMILEFFFIHGGAEHLIADFEEEEG